MGSSQSTRKITVPNESAHIIKVSDSVIERLKNAEGSQQSSAKPIYETITPTPQPASQKPQPVYQNLPAAAGSLTSLQVLQEKERQLKENDTYWANRVRALEDAQNKNNRLMEQEFVRTVAAIENKLPQIPKKLSEAPCSDKKSKVLDCYKNNPRQILLCSQEVADFASCVDMKRLAAS